MTATQAARNISAEPTISELRRASWQKPFVHECLALHTTYDVESIALVGGAPA